MDKIERSAGMNKKLILLTGLILRELLSFWTAHPYDFEIWVRLGHHVAGGGNPYTYLYYIEGLSFAPYETLASIGYPPLWALFCGSSYVIYQTFCNISIRCLGYLSTYHMKPLTRMRSVLSLSLSLFNSCIFHGSI